MKACFAVVHKRMDSSNNYLHGMQQISDIRYLHDYRALITASERMHLASPTCNLLTKGVP